MAIEKYVKNIKIIVNLRTKEKSKFDNREIIFQS